MVIKLNIIVESNKFQLTSSISNTGFCIISRVIGQRKSRGGGELCWLVIMFFRYSYGCLRLERKNTDAFICSIARRHFTTNMLLCHPLVERARTNEKVYIGERRERVYMNKWCNGI